MKKLKLLGLIATMLILATLLVACGSAATLRKVYNKDYDTSDKLYTKADNIAELDNFSLLTTDEGLLENGEFAVFTKANAENGMLEYKVFSFRKGAVVQTLANTDKETFEISFLEGAPVYVVDKTVVATEEGAEAVETRTYYDANGTELAKMNVDEEISEPRVLTKKLVIINSVLYDVDTVSGALSENREIPVYVSYSFDDEQYDYNDEYFYAWDESMVVVYDLDFMPVANYMFPSYSYIPEYWGNGVHVLNNGNVLIQYGIELDEDAKKFDFHEEGKKYDLVSMILTPKGKIKNIDLDYIVPWVSTNNLLYDDAKDASENEYTDNFENIAYLYKIANQKIDYSYANMDIVLLSNSAKIQKSLKIVDGQVGALRRLTNDLYVASTVYGMAIVNEKGKVEFAVTATDSIVAVHGGYIVTNHAIYDMNFEMVYNLLAHDAELYTEEAYFGNTVFVKAGDDKKYDIIAFNTSFEEGRKTIYSYDAKNEKNATFALWSDQAEGSMSVNEYIGYVITDADGNRTYYNAAGTELLKTKSDVQIIAAGNDYDRFIVKVSDDNVAKYYFVSE